MARLSIFMLSFARAEVVEVVIDRFGAMPAMQQLKHLTINID